jgi:hypothetical protein
MRLKSRGTIEPVLLYLEDRESRERVIAPSLSVAGTESEKLIG